MIEMVWRARENNESERNKVSGQQTLEELGQLNFELKEAVIALLYECENLHEQAYPKGSQKYCDGNCPTGEAIRKGKELLARVRAAQWGPVEQGGKAVSGRKAKWTPGPWTWGNDGESMPIVTAHSRPGYVAFVRDPGCVEESEIAANARLIASAPELAEALREAVTFFIEFDTDETVSGADLVDWFSEWRAKAKAVLAKAEGGKP